MPKRKAPPPRVVAKYSFDDGTRYTVPLAEQVVHTLRDAFKVEQIAETVADPSERRQLLATADAMTRRATTLIGAAFAELAAYHVRQDKAGKAQHDQADPIRAKVQTCVDALTRKGARVTGPAVSNKWAALALGPVPTTRHIQRILRALRDSRHT